VIKLYEYPENFSGFMTVSDYEKRESLAGNIGIGTNGIQYSINRPDLWAMNVEIDFGNGLYGRRANRSGDAFAAWTEFWLFYQTNIYLVSCGGIVKLTRADNGYVVAFPVGSPSYGSNISSMPAFPFNVGFSIESAYPPISTIAVVIRCAARFNITAYTCDLWITYKK
jgi:hypothetical protein